MGATPCASQGLIRETRPPRGNLHSLAVPGIHAGVWLVNAVYFAIMRGMEPHVIVWSGLQDALLSRTLDALALGGVRRVHVMTCSDRRITRGYRGVAVQAVEPGADDEAWLAGMRAIRADGPAPVLLPVRLPDVRRVSRLRDRLAPVVPVVIPDPEWIDVLVDKFRFFQTCRATGLPVPASIAVEPGMDPGEVARLGFPLLAKPRCGEAGIGIRLLSDDGALRDFLAGCPAPGHYLLQPVIGGEDVAFTMLADRGKVFACSIKRRWYTPPGVGLFASVVNVSFERWPWLEELGCAWVERVGYSGIADFDLRVDVERQRALFLESDPRMMGSVVAGALFGVNVPRLLVDRACGRNSGRSVIHAEPGHFLSIRSLPGWLRSGQWRHPRCGPVRMNWRSHGDRLMPGRGPFC